VLSGREAVRPERRTTLNLVRTAHPKEYIETEISAAIYKRIADIAKDSDYDECQGTRGRFGHCPLRGKLLDYALPRPPPNGAGASIDRRATNWRSSSRRYSG